MATLIRLNILVDRIGDKWHVSAILDWEFAQSGSPLWDVANMLRYAHEMPSEFQNSFLNGLLENGFIFSKHWQITVHLMTLSSLLDLMIRSKDHPIRLADITKLIDHHMEQLIEYGRAS